VAQKRTRVQKWNFAASYARVAAVGIVLLL